MVGALSARAVCLGVPPNQRLKLIAAVVHGAVESSLSVVLSSLDKGKGPVGCYFLLFFFSCCFLLYWPAVAPFGVVHRRDGDGDDGHDIGAGG